jgi:heme-degrading monooxygenase HmoA
MSAEAPMIVRQWRGLARHDGATAYLRHLQTETFSRLRGIEGFVGARVLRRAHANGVEFIVETSWRSLDDIRRFAGADAEIAVVPPAAAALMLEYDARARHYEVID